MILVEAFLSWISQAVLFGRSILSKLFSNSLTIGFLPIFIAVIVFGALVAYVIRPFLAAGSSDLADKGVKLANDEVKSRYRNYRLNKRERERLASLRSFKMPGRR